MCGSTTVTYGCVCARARMYTNRVWLEDMWSSVCHMGLQLNSSLISLGSRHICPGAILSTRFFYLSKAEACPFGYTASQQAPGICLSLSPAGLKVHTIMSGLYTFWGSKVYTLPTTPSPPALLKPNLEIQICMYHTRSSHYRETRNPKKAGSSPSSASAAMGT